MTLERFVVVDRGAGLGTSGEVYDDLQEATNVAYDRAALRGTQEVIALKFELTDSELVTRIEKVSK